LALKVEESLGKVGHALETTETVSLFNQQSKIHPAAGF